MKSYIKIVLNKKSFTTFNFTFLLHTKPNIETTALSNDLVGNCLNRSFQMDFFKH